MSFTFKLYIFSLTALSSVYYAGYLTGWKSYILITIGMVAFYKMCTVLIDETIEAVGCKHSRDEIVSGDSS